MIDESQLRHRFLADDVPRRLGNLSSTLSRLSDFLTMGLGTDAVLGVMDESQRFVQWTHGDLSHDAARELDALAVELKHWRAAWVEIAQDPVRVAGIADQAKVWSERVLDLSGLLQSNS